MIAVVQRVSEASVTVDGEVVGRIGPGLLVLAAVHRTDTDSDITWTANKLAGLRIFRNGDKYFDADVKQAGGSILLVSNFTVAANTREGRRPSFIAAAETETGRFGADMLVSLVNDGPVTVIVDSTEGRSPKPS